MASDLHQALTGFLSKRMAWDGFEVTHFDGQLCTGAGGGKMALPPPPSIGSHRPDLVAVHRKLRIYGIGEAKTPWDFKSLRTETQFREFSTLFMAESGRRCHLYIAVVESSLQAARTTLVKCRLHGRPNVHLVAIPDVLALAK